MKKGKQVIILNQEKYTKTKESYKKDMDEDLSFEEYVNMVLGTIFDNGDEVVDIKPNNDATVIVIIYLMKMSN